MVVPSVKCSAHGNDWKTYLSSFGTVAPKRRYWTTAQIFLVDPAGISGASPTALLRQGRAFHVYGGGGFE